jgi:hypothetical protein
MKETENAARASQRSDRRLVIGLLALGVLRLLQIGAIVSMVNSFLGGFADTAALATFGIASAIAWLAQMGCIAIDAWGERP